MFSASFRGTLNWGGNDLAAIGQDLFLAKLSPSFEHLWSKRFGSGDDFFVFPFGVAVDREDRILVTGMTARALDFGLGPLSVNDDEASAAFLAKFEP